MPPLVALFFLPLLEVSYISNNSRNFMQMTHVCGLCHMFQHNLKFLFFGFVTSILIMENALKELVQLIKECQRPQVKTNALSALSSKFLFYQILLFFIRISSS